jgi:hypothetical protein
MAIERQNNFMTRFKKTNKWVYVCEDEGLSGLSADYTQNKVTVNEAFFLNKFMYAYCDFIPLSNTLCILALGM